MIIQRLKIKNKLLSSKINKVTSKLVSEFEKELSAHSKKELHYKDEITQLRTLLSTQRLISSSAELIPSEISKKHPKLKKLVNQNKKLLLQMKEMNDVNMIKKLVGRTLLKPDNKRLELALEKALKSLNLTKQKLKILKKIRLQEIEEMRNEIATIREYTQLGKQTFFKEYMKILKDLISAHDIGKRGSELRLDDLEKMMFDNEGRIQQLLNAKVRPEIMSSKSIK